jgi:CheY-like chemotaxis protein
MSVDTKRRLLVVDDEPHIRDAVTQWFEQHGFIVQAAENGKRAVEVCAENPFDVIIMDLEMPVMKGPEAIRLIRETHPDLPIAVFTGFSSRIREAKEFGATIILQKPLGLRELEKEILAILPG